LETRKSKSQRGDATDSEQSPTRILVVEDDFLIAMQTETALSDAGFEVVGTAATAEEAISLAREKHPALAVTDIRLAGERDGIDAARQLFSEFDDRRRAAARQRSGTRRFIEMMYFRAQPILRTDRKLAAR